MSDYAEIDAEEFMRPVAKCNRCHRLTWEPDAVGTEDRMPQPDGNPCGGRFEAPGNAR